MRLSPLSSAALILWMCTPALAQEWKEFAFQQDRFTCNFPGDPKITDTTFMSQFGHRLPARVYSVELSPNHKFSVTVVDYSNITQLGLEKQKACPGWLGGVPRRLGRTRQFNRPGLLESR